MAAKEDARNASTRSRNVERLKQGVRAWNTLRRDRATLRPRRGPYLSRTELSFGNLSGVDLMRADQTEAHLIGTKLSKANLSNAALRQADLTHANLSGADLTRAVLVRAVLTHSDLTQTTFEETVLSNLNLASVIGLETCHHRGPSSIDHLTLKRSSSLPIPFLRGLGLPEPLIEYLPSIFDRAIQYYSCFISYSTKDQDFADRIHADLQHRGVRCWFAPHDLPIGGKILDEIDAAIQLRDKLLLILSEHSIKSGWVEDEVSKALAEERKREQIVLFPIRLDEAVMVTNRAWAAKLREQRNIGDFTRWKEHSAYVKSFERVLRDLAPKPSDKN